MDLTGILSISGHGGLFKLIKQSKSGFIVESLVNKKRMQAFASAKISTLEDIAIYTETGEVHLKDVFRKIFEQENEQKLSLTAKSPGNDLKSFFVKVLPDYDPERVYVSDIKKVVNWYNLLVEHGLIDMEPDQEEADGEEADKQKEDTKEDSKEDEEQKEKSTKAKSTKKSEDKKTE